MECVASTKARPPSDREESSDGDLEEDQASQIGDGILNDKEKDALRTLALSEDCNDPLEGTSEMLTTWTVEESNEGGIDSDDDQCTSTLRRALDLSSPAPYDTDKLPAS